VAEATNGEAFGAFYSTQEEEEVVLGKRRRLPAVGGHKGIGFGERKRGWHRLKEGKRRRWCGESFSCGGVSRRSSGQQRRRQLRAAAVASSLVPKEGEDLVAGRSGTLGQPDSPNSSAPKSTISRDPGADTSSSKWSPEVG
jgi:hypothetical protein